MDLEFFKPHTSFNTYNAPPKQLSSKQLIQKDIQENMSDVDYGPHLGLMDAINDQSVQVFTHDGSGNWGRAFRQFNFIEGLYRLSVMGQYEDVEGFDPIAHPAMENIPEMDRYRFINAGSEGELLQKIDYYRSDLEDMEMLMSGPSLYPILSASLASPTSFAPLAPLKFMRSGSVWKRFAGGGIFTAALIAPEELLLAGTIESRDIGHAVLSMGAGAIIGGTLASALGGPSKSLLSGTSSTKEPIPRSAGAAANPKFARDTGRLTMEGDALAETGVGIEKLGWNPVTRLLKSDNFIVRKIVPQLVDIGGLIQKKVKQKASETDQSIESTFRARWIPGLLDSIKSIDVQYLAYRNIVAKKGDISRSLQMLRIQASDLVGRRTNFMTQAEFRQRVTYAMRRGDKDPINDEATSFVNKAAVDLRKHFDDIKDEATNVKLFERQAQKVIAGLKKKIDDAPEGTAKVQLQTALVKAKEYLKQIRATGVNVNTAISYLPRIVRVDKVLANQEGWVRILTKYGKAKLGLDDKAAKDFANETLDRAIHNKPWFDVEGTADIDWITSASSTKARSLEIPDEVIEDFLENDIEVLLRHHTKTMGTDIELQRMFGDVSMQPVLKEIQDEFEILLRQTDDVVERAKIKQQAEQNISDIKALRDRTRGTYGAAKDPHQLASRFTRFMKSFNVIVGMGSATISSIPDMARTIMTEGFRNFHEKGLRNLFKDTDSAIKKMTQKEIKQAGIAADAVLGLRASAFSDIGDLFGSRMAFERGMQKSTGLFFLMNGLNYWNQAMKSFAGGVIMMRMTESIMKPWSKLTSRQKEKLLANGINEQDHSRMALSIRNHGEQVDGEWMPNTELWTDRTMAMKFRVALNQSVDRTIVTPGAGDRALWTSTEFGSLITQFKGYSQGAMVRVLTSGLQEKDQAFWQGAFLMVGLAYFVNEAKKIQYGIEKEDNFFEGLVNAIDRSGTLGWFTDVNNALEKISDYKLGLRAVVGENNPKRLPFGAKVGALGGPSAANLTTAGAFVTDAITGNVDENSLKSLRFITPGGNLPYFDPILDGVYGE